MRRTGKSTDVVGWIAIGLLAAVTGELVFPGRQKPGGITVMLLVGAKGALLGRFLVGLVAGTGETQFDTASILWATLGAPTPLTLFRIIASLRRKSREG